MKITRNTLEVVIGTWDDPGDYPNSLASGPLPSRDFVEEIGGECVIELDAVDMEVVAATGIDHFDPLYDFAFDAVPDGISVGSWGAVLEGNKVTLEVADFCAVDYQPPEPPDMED